MFPPPSHFHVGDSVLACLDTVPFTTSTGKEWISVFDLTADTHLESIYGPEGAWNTGMKALVFALAVALACKIAAQVLA